MRDRIAAHTDEKSIAFDWLNSNHDSLIELSHEIFGYAEPSFREYKSAQALEHMLETHGFDIESGAGDMPTAFVGIREFGDGGPTIGLFAEYDATPGDSQMGVPYKQPVQNRAAGYGDAHNALGTASTGAAIAVGEAMKEHDLNGTVKIYGTPAEKIVAGKPYLAKEGYFDDLDAVVAWHPHSVNTTAWDAGPSPYRSFVVNFEGEAFTAAKPWNGTDALDAATLMRVMINFMKEHVTHDPPEENPAIGSIITNGGQHPTNMAEFSQIYFGLRGTQLSTMDDMEALIKRCAEAAATVTGCGYDVRHVVSTRYWLPNHEMAKLAFANIGLVGPPTYSEEAKQFANTVLENVGRRPVKEPFDESLIDPEREVTSQFYPGIADDVSEFSWAAPTARIYLSYYIQGRHKVKDGDEEDVPWYTKRLKSGGYNRERKGMPTWTTASLADTEVANECLFVASKVMAATTLDLLTNQDALDSAQEEYDRRTSETMIPLLLDEDDKPPTDITFPPYYSKDWEVPTNIGHGS
jgi:aminobenzoyl-glutamate utilization protein B